MDGLELEKRINEWSELVYGTMSLSEDFKEEFPDDSGRKYVIPELNKLGLEMWLEHDEISTHLIPDEKFMKSLDMAKLIMALDHLKEEGLIDSFIGDDGEERFFLRKEKEEEVKNLIKLGTK